MLPWQILGVNSRCCRRRSVDVREVPNHPLPAGPRGQRPAPHGTGRGKLSATGTSARRNPPATSRPGPATWRDSRARARAFAEARPSSPSPLAGRALRGIALVPPVLGGKARRWGSVFLPLAGKARRWGPCFASAVRGRARVGSPKASFIAPAQCYNHPMIRAVVTDLDNTLYSWVNYIVPALEAMVTSLCETTGYPRIRVVQALKEGLRAGRHQRLRLRDSGIFRSSRKASFTATSTASTPSSSSPPRKPSQARPVASTW